MRCLICLILLATVSATLNAQPTEVAPHLNKPTSVGSNSPIAPQLIMGVYPSNSVYNYVRTWEPYVPSTDPNILTIGVPLHTAKVTTEYMDGLGRPLQTVIKNGCVAPTLHDWVKVHVYDEKGREAKTILPYSDPSDDGKFKTNPVNEIVQDYTNYRNSELPISVTLFDNSPLDRVVTQMPPGGNMYGLSNGWYGQNYYETNTVADKVISWRGSDLFNYSYYPANTLFKYTKIDGDGKTTIEYKDKLNRLVLSKVQSADNPGIDHSGWACTYYIYDDFGRLAYVFTPEAVSEIVNIINTSPQNLSSVLLHIIQRLCYSYGYDEHGNLVSKLLPGVGMESYVYDPLDRLVLSQDGNLSANGKWKYTVYDILDRPCITGIYNPATPINRTDLTNNINASTPVYTTPNHPLTRISNWRTVFNPLPNYSGSGTSTFPDFEELTFTLYDYYNYPSYISLPNAVYDASLHNQLTALTPNVGQVTPQLSEMTRGIATASFVKVMDANGKMLKTQNFFDAEGRLIQQHSENINNDVDVTSYVYTFNGDIAHSMLRHNNPDAIAPSNFADPNLFKRTDIVKSYKYHPLIEKVNRVSQNINNTLDVQLAYYKWDGLNTVSEKVMPPMFEEYEYNARGWLTSINRQHVEDRINSTNINQNNGLLFGELIRYEKGFESKYFNGNIAGTIWRGPGTKSPARFYGYSYDKMNRLTHAEFEELTYNAQSWSKAAIDYTVSNISYDLNGNITGLLRRGVENTNPPFDMDVLTYNYDPLSNTLMSVSDASTTASALPDFKDNASDPIEFSFDANGNMRTDMNKGITTPISYSYLNKPEEINVNNKGNVTYVYDALGNRLQKIIEDDVQNTTVTYDYIGPFVYKDDLLQYISHDEGRCRPKLDKPNETVASFYYDFFTKDHLGNVRAVMTTREVGLLDYVASHEVAMAGVEELVWENLDYVREPKPDAIDPADVMAAELVGSDPSRRIGTAIMLKVMPGDKFELSVDSYFESEEIQEGGVDAEDVVNSLFSAFTGGTTMDGTPVAELPNNYRILENSFVNGEFSALYETMLQNNTDPMKPRGYLNYMVFDEQFNLVDGQSGIIQVDGQAQQWNVIGTGGQIEVGQAGYLSVFISSADLTQSLFMDDVLLRLERGSVVEEDHYYPFGLTITASDPSTQKNYIKYNSKELQRDEFTGSMGAKSGLELYDYGARMYDPQIGRWMQIDPLADHSNQIRMSAYQAFWNNPVKYNDPDGKCPDCPDGIYVPIADHVYGAQVGDVTDNGWKVVRVDENKSGFLGALYEGTYNGKAEYIYATAGTQDISDAATDVKQLFGTSEQYRESVTLAKDVAGEYSGVSFTGHSLGGGLASANALATESKGVTFNAAALSGATKSKLSLNDNQANITAYIVSGELVNALQNSIGLQAEGNHLVFLPGVGKNAIDKHMMQNVKEAFKIWETFKNDPNTETFIYE